MSLTVGAEVELQIEKVVYRGRGLAHHEGCVVFIPGVIPGETVRATIVRARQRYAEARLEEILTPSEFRIEQACGLLEAPSRAVPGCTYGHIAYEEEVRIKQGQLENFLERTGFPEAPEFLDPVPSPLDVHYRNKAVLHAQKQDDRTVLGYYGDDNSTVVDISACPLAVDAINEKLAELRADTDWIEDLEDGEAVTLRWTPTDGVVYWRGRELPEVKRIQEVTPLGLLNVPSRSFYQVNTEVASHLIKAVGNVAASFEPDYMVDVYSGAGSFALAGAQSGARRVVGIESDSRAIRAARANARELDLDARFIESSAGESLCNALERISMRSCMVVLDPPRAGLDDDVMKTLQRKRPNTIVYVSCAPDTLQRDLKILAGSGYHLKLARMFDMFPRTPHFETMVVLKWVPTFRSEERPPRRSD